MARRVPPIPSFDVWAASRPLPAGDCRGCGAALTSHVCDYCGRRAAGAADHSPAPRGPAPARPNDVQVR